MTKELEHKDRFSAGNAGPSRREAGQREWRLDALHLVNLELGGRLQRSLQRSHLDSGLGGPRRTASAGENQRAHSYCVEQMA